MVVGVGVDVLVLEVCVVEVGVVEVEVVVDGRVEDEPEGGPPVGDEVRVSLGRGGRPLPAVAERAGEVVAAGVPDDDPGGVIPAVVDVLARAPAGVVPSGSVGCPTSGVCAPSGVTTAPDLRVRSGTWLPKATTNPATAPENASTLRHANTVARTWTKDGDDTGLLQAVDQARSCRRADRIGMLARTTTCRGW
ncbi:MAG: hypothetical protein ACRC35_12190 [Angustibacter sp.]